MQPTYLLEFSIYTSLSVKFTGWQKPVVGLYRIITVSGHVPCIKGLSQENWLFDDAIYTSIPGHILYCSTTTKFVIFHWKLSFSLLACRHGVYGCVRHFQLLHEVTLYIVQCGHSQNTSAFLTSQIDIYSFIILRNRGIRMGTTWAVDILYLRFLFLRDPPVKKRVHMNLAVNNFKMIKPTQFTDLYL